MIHAHPRRVSRAHQRVLIRGKFADTFFKRLPLRIELPAHFLRLLGDGRHRVLAKKMPVARPVAPPRHHLHARDAKGPRAKFRRAREFAKLPPQHHGHFLHHLARILARRHQRTHKAAQRRLVLRVETEELIVVELGGGWHLSR